MLNIKSFILILVICIANPSFAQVVNTEQGKIVGYVEDGIYTFKGIPYAEPPIGPLRWQSPKAQTRSNAQINATGFGKICMQRINERRGTSLEDMSEDCLTLNVWSPKIDTGKRPVMVYIHGGGFRSGSGRSRGEVFAHKGAVVVSMNYRLGALGFFAHEALPEQDANPGLLDVIQSLKWIKSNIADFGGDPDNVTIFGISAGGAIVNLLSSNDKAKGLFNRAIAQSGYAAWPLHRSVSAPNPAPLNSNMQQSISAEAHAHQLISKLTDKSQTKELLLGLDANDIVNTVNTNHLPIVDGSSILEEPAIRFLRGKQLDVAYMSGGNSFDGSSIGGLGPSGPIDLEISMGMDIDKARQLYKDDTDSIWLTRMWGDNRYVLSGRILAKSMKMKGQRAWLYYTNFIEQEDKQSSPGTSHGKGGSFLFRTNDDNSEAARALSSDLRNYWFNFASTGDPNGEGLPNWPNYTSESDIWMQFGDAREAKSGIIKEKLDFLEQKYLERVAPALTQ